MENVRNYQKELDKIIAQLEKEGQLGKTLLLHSCCAPCSSYCLEYLKKYFRITVFYYNPNISMQEEYIKRVEEQKRLIKAYNELGEGYHIDVIEGDYEPEKFYEIARELENCPEGGERCFRCYEQRLRKTAQLAKEKNADYFTTTLTISPLKNAQKLNEIGEALADELSINWLVSDFKKKNGYKRSIELSVEYDLYRQNYCGCIYSKVEQENRVKERE